MKKISTILSILILGFAAVSLQAQPGCAWAKKAGGTQEDWGKSVATDNAGNVYYLGNFYSQSITVGTTVLQNQPYTYSNYGAEMFLAKYDSCGNFKWAKRAGGNAETHGEGLAVDASGNVYVSGYSNCDTTTFGTIKMINRTYYDAFVVKYDANGNAIWFVQGNGDDVDKAYAVTTDAAGNVYATGSSGSNYIRFGADSVAHGPGTSNDYEVFVVKINSSGAVQWVRVGTGDSDDYGQGIGADAAGNVYVGGYYGSTVLTVGSFTANQAGYNDIFIAKYDANGVAQWLKSAGNTDDDEASALVTDASGNSYITGILGYASNVTFGTHTVVNATPSYAMYITKYDASGTALWANIGQGNAYTLSQGTGLSLDAQGNPYVIGYYDSDSLTFGPVSIYNYNYANGGGAIYDSLYDVFVAKYKSNGWLQWARSAGGSMHDYGQGIATGPHQALYICGEYQSPSVSFNGITLSTTNNVGDAFISNNISTNSILSELCLVTCDSTSTNNVLYWDKTAFTSADSFIVYREVQTNIYKRIGALPYSALSQFTDTARSVGPANGDPNIGTYRYKLQVLDTAGTMSLLGPYHNTLYYVNNSGTFTWNVYSVENMTVTPVTTFNMLRDDNHTGQWHVIGSVAGTQTTLNDPQYATYQSTADWRVEALGFNCTPTARYSNGIQATIVKSKSNISNNRGIGVQQINDPAAALNVYPNPASGSVFVVSGKELNTISLYNSMGGLVYQLKSKNTKEEIDLTKLPAGIYVLQVNGKTTRLVKE
jgi:hypothetical protein